MIGSLEIKTEGTHHPGAGHSFHDGGYRLCELVKGGEVFERVHGEMFVVEIDNCPKRLIPPMDNEIEGCKI